jgi:hypothetical protein
MLLQFPTYKEGIGERGRKQEGGGGGREIKREGRTPKIPLKSYPQKIRVIHITILGKTILFQEKYTCRYYV